MRDVVIYGLRDPRTDAVRYVGWCFKSRIRQRESEHLSRSRVGTEKTNKARWIKALLAAGMKPLFVVLEHTTEGARGDRECWWITEMRKFGPLTNSSDGGPGCPGYRHSPEVVAGIKARLIGVPKTKEHRERLSAARRGTKASTATRIAMSESRRGRRMPPAAIEKTAKAHRGRKRPQAAIEKMRAAWAKRLAVRGEELGVRLEGDRWGVRVCFGGRAKWIGSFGTKEEAISARDTAIAEYCRRTRV